MKKAAVIAWYECKLILRSRLFRIFAFIALAAQSGAVILLYFTRYYSRWSLRAVPSSIPYSAVLFYNSIAMIAGIMIATDFLRRDLKLGTTEAVYYRDFPTPLYFIGKGVGVITALLGLECVILLVPFTANLFFITDTPVSLTGYLLYPLLLTIPALLFTMGMSWCIMLFTKSQPVTFMAGVLIFAAMAWSNRIPALHHLLDYPGLRIPALYSDFVGFSGAGQLLTQRAVFAALGIALMAFASLLLPRLPQSKSARHHAAVLAGIMLFAAGGLTVLYLGGFARASELREELRALNSTYSTLPRVSMTACDLAVTHEQNRIGATASIVVTNHADAPIDTCFFSLNPGLAVTSVESRSGNLSYTRNHHILEVVRPMSLLPGESDSLVIAYSGTIDDEICYLDTPESERGDSFDLAFMPVKSRSGFVTPDCVLLTPETLWYPVAGVPYGSTFPDLGRKDFVRFTLSVETSDGLTTVSQGHPQTTPSGITVFNPETPLPHLSLFIADYEMKSVEIDSVTYAIYHLPGHDYFAPYLSKYDEILPEHIRERHESAEMHYGRSYPYDYFFLVEVPIQFMPRTRTWTIIQDNIQPGITLVHERGTYLRDLPRLVESFGDDITAGSPDNEYRDMFLRNILFPLVENPYSRGIQLSTVTHDPLFSRNTLFHFITAQELAVYNIFPNFYTFTNHIHSSRWPLMDAMVERYLAIGTVTIAMMGTETFGTGDIANMLLNAQNLPEILSDNTDPDIRNIVMSAKMSQFFNLFNARFGREEFFRRLADEWERTRFTSEPFPVFLDSLYGTDTKNIMDYLDEWYHATDLPICQFHNISHFELQHGERNYYQLMTTLSNPSNADGLFRISGRTMPQTEQAGSSGYESFERYVPVPAGAARCVCIIGDDPFFRTITVETSISQNLPSSFTIPIPAFKKNTMLSLTDSILTVDPATLLPEPGIIIADNADTGCVAQTKEQTSWFRKMFPTDKPEEQEYIPFNFYDPYTAWTKTFSSSLYGDYIRSAVFKTPGDGTQPFVWWAEITEAGTYDVYTHVSTSLGQGFRIVEKGTTHQRPNIGTLHYTIHHDNSTDTIAIDGMNQPEEWVLLGSFYFSEGEAVVELSDKSDGRIVYADAIKWVKQ